MTHIILIDWYGPLEIIKAGTLLNSIESGSYYQHNFQYYSKTYEERFSFTIATEYTAPISSLLRELL
jgi:hypothetical protein